MVQSQQMSLVIKYEEQCMGKITMATGTWECVNIWVEKKKKNTERADRNDRTGMTGQEGQNGQDGQDGQNREHGKTRRV